VANPSLTVNVKGDTSSLDEALSGVSGKIDGFAANLANPTTKLGKLADVGVRAAKVTVDLAKDGADAAKSNEQFAQSMEQLGVATGDWVAKTDAAIAAGAKLAFTDTEVQGALVHLTTATGDLDAAIATLPGVMDIARGAQVDLGTAADAAALAINGQDAPLKRMMKGLESGATAMDTLNTAMLNNTMQGDIWASSAEGQAERARIAMSEAGEAIGTKLYEAFGAIRDIMQPVMDALGPFMDAVRELLNVIMPALNPLIKIFAEFLSRVAYALSQIITWATKVLTFVSDLLAKLQDVRDKLDEIMPDFNILNGEGLIGRTDSRGFFQERDWMNKNGYTQGPTGKSGAGVGSTMAAPMNMTINIHGDPAVIEAKVASAIRNYNRRNGAGAIFSPGRS
jgi:hypothetical protein